MANSTPQKPKANHPWKNCTPFKVTSWAKEQSYIPNVTNVSVARNETLQRKETSKIDKKRGAF
ncbi:hypothetical protein D1B33_18055 [Lysinibacillus yapensis]|uniref:Uncharacterized protein n=1 Tax=Ureibacillus yapensis TaxID=2304605 RepID=A0A396S641_9BACL|nr:hypothetical protein [Lysinibacillus yapensis]RHW31111.1 hypothetical protein D1B33_18055 [Lysinibacillus yapensis]